MSGYSFHRDHPEPSPRKRPAPDTYPSVEFIQNIVSRHFSVPVIEMKSARRGQSVARPRMAAMYLARKHTLLSLPQIGRLFGNRDHTTVIHATRRVEDLRRDDRRFDADLAVIEARL